MKIKFNQGVVTSDGIFYKNMTFEINELTHEYKYLLEQKQIELIEDIKSEDNSEKKPIKKGKKNDV